MSTAPQLPDGYSFVDQQPSGPPKLPKGYALLHPEEQANTPPTPPSYLGEALAGVGRAAKGLLYDLPKYGASTFVPRSKGEAVLGAVNPLTLSAKHVIQDLGSQWGQAEEASRQAKRQGEGRAGQTLAELERLPVVGGMVQKAEEAGPGYAKFAPQTLGAATEALTTFEGPQMVAGAARGLNRALPSIPRGGAGMELIKRSAYGDAPVVNVAESAKLTQELADDYMKGGAPLPQPVAEHMRRVAAGEPYNFRELHDQQQLINNALYKDRNVPKSIEPQVKKISGLMSQELQATADANGFGKEWASQAGEVRQGYKTTRAVQKVAPVAGKVIGGVAGAIAPEMVPVEGAGRTLQVAGVPVSSYFGQKIGGKVGQAAADVTRAVMQRKAGPPKLRPLPPSPEAYTREILRAKDGEISGGEADRRITKMGGRVKVRPIPQPTE